MRTLTFELPSALLAARVLECDIVSAPVAADLVHVMGVDRPAVWTTPTKALKSRNELGYGHAKQRSANAQRPTAAFWATGATRGVPPRGRPV